MTRIEEKNNALYNVLRQALEHHAVNAAALQADRYYAEELRATLEQTLQTVFDRPTPSERLEMLQEAVRRTKGFYDRYRDRLSNSHPGAETVRSVHAALNAAALL